MILINFTESSLSQGGIIATACVTVFIVTSILFSTIGYMCGLHRRKKERNNFPSSANKPAPIYESVRIRDQKETLDLDTNIAYAQVQ